MTTRQFSISKAKRSQVPLVVGLMGPSGGGKTFSALRLASGIVKAQGGRVGVIDTEAKRALHYASLFDFDHLEFGAPFGSLDYLEAMKAMAAAGCTTIIVDSMSHEHEGPGGVLESHEVEAERLAKLWKTSVQNTNMAAWASPKQDRSRLINEMLQMPVNFILCFRAKEKLKVVKGDKPQPMGYMPIAGEEFVYECTVCTLLLPGAGGIPTWQSDETGERAMIKLPEQFRKLFLGQNGPLDERAGEALARWAMGDAPSSTTASKQAELAARLRECTTKDGLAAIKAELGGIKGAMSKEELHVFSTAFQAAQSRLDGANEVAT
jgi:hypothetical protein